MADIAIRTLPIADAIRERMDQDDLSMRATADMLGVSHGTVDNWINKGRKPDLFDDPQLQLRLAAYLGISPRDVLTLCGFDLSGRKLRRIGVTQPFPQPIPHLLGRAA